MWRVPSLSAQAGGTMITPTVDVDSTFTALGIGGSYTSLIFTVTLLPLFDLYVAMDQVGSLQLQCAFAASGAGSTFRDVDNVIIIPAMGTLAFRLLGYRVPNLLARWVLTNTSGVACTFTEAVFINRSL